MSDLEPLNPPRFDYIEVKGQPEVDYKKLYELQRYTSKRLCVIILQYIDMLKKTVKGNDAIIDDCNLAKEKIEKLMLEM